ncbi:MAG: HDIG domain-containing protein [Lentisphaeria bacterium]|nr:HDIG domain-containing protein [Lentisphaeria bacterium]
MNNPEKLSVQPSNNILTGSAVPTILVLVLIWVTAAVLLTISVLTQRDFTIFKKGDAAPFSTWALTDFSYIDKAKTSAEKAAARKKAPEYLLISDARSKELNDDLDTFFTAARNRAEMELQKQKYVPSASVPAQMAGKFVHFDELKNLLGNRIAFEALRRAFASFVSHGIALKEQLVNPNIRIITSGERLLDNFTPPDAGNAAAQIIRKIKGSPEFKSELGEILAVILAPGNLVFDKERTAADQEEAAKAVNDSYKFCRAGELMVAQGALITEEMIDKIQAEKDMLPHNFGMAVFYYRLAVSFLLLVVAFFFLYITYPGFLNSPHSTTLAGVTVILSMILNYAVIYGFFHLVKSERISDYQLLFAMVPIPLCAALCTAFLGNRTAIFSLFLVSSVSAMMAFPDRSFEQALRWFFIGVLVALSVRNVRNYRSFFFRVFIFGAFSIALINSDILFNAGRKIFLEAAAVIFINSFGCAVASLLLVFVFELIFNADTNMSLMVLCDHSHPLLDELKRRAPGTMFHSMNVATLAEDAARAIGANPLKAKAGALFHDIGKLSNPGYFVENNVDSPAEHEQLPPRQSCSIIREHVTEGMNLSRKYRLSRFIKEAISTHHGDDLVSFFYRKALEIHENNPGSAAVIEADFRYTGNAPYGRELTIISLADACEAACRSIKDTTESNIREMVENIFIHRFRNNQLRASKLTLNELNIVRESFIKDLVNFNHGRIAYNKEKKHDPTQQPVVLPEQKSSEEK